MDLVVHHVLQSLVVRRANEDLSVQLTTSESIEQHLQVRVEVKYVRVEVNR